jgi:choline dehydrogenase-like flavoprotein
MLIDLATEKVAAVLRTDVAIVGSGPAGLSLARRLETHGHDVLLIESGSLSYADHAQELNAGEDAAGRHSYVRASRVRAFGGTSFAWAGWCTTLDSTDFEQRSWVRHSGWPISARDLGSYYAEATEICDLDGRHFDTAKWSAERQQAALRWSGDDFSTSYFQLSPPTRFGTKYRAPITASKKVTALLNATVTGIRLEANGRSCRALAVSAPDGKQFQVQARKYVIACGGIENARLLLLSNDVHTSGVGNTSDLVGRFFMDHPAFTSGAMVPTDPNLNVDFYIYDSHPKLRGFGTITPTRSLMQRLGSSHFNIELMAQFDGLGNSLNALKEDYWTLEQRAKRGELLGKFGSNVSTFFSMLGNGASYAWWKVGSGHRTLRHVDLRHHLECSPNPDSRVTLSTTRKDRFGLPAVRLDWRINRSDVDGWLRCQEALALAFGRSNVGRMRLDFDASKPLEALNIGSSWHHIGTTRMHSDPKQGVVDADCRVHGVSNLYIAGSSVFPTSGHANPTLTIVALALRLGDHLGRKE